MEQIGVPHNKTRFTKGLIEFIELPTSLIMLKIVPCA